MLLKLEMKNIIITVSIIRRIVFEIKIYLEGLIWDCRQELIQP